MTRLRLGLTGLAVVLLGGLLMAQDRKTTDKDTPPPSGSLPPYFRRLGLSDEQNRAVRKVHGEYKSKIDVLTKKIRDLRLEERDQLDKVLTPEQRTRLRELRAGPPAKDTRPPAKDKSKDKSSAKDK
jgi:Spy/CpxP family protein refolding chaperone